MNIAELAKMMNASEADVAGFVSCLRIWTDKGFTVEQAIERNMEQMRRIANNTMELVKIAKPICVDAFFPAAA